ncbi:MAG: hypothetical protein U0U67_08890 [Chitinophagales bacterium]
MMTETLSKVVHQIETLSESEQNEIANLLSDELSWTTTFAKSQDFLSALAEEALEEYKANKTKPI